MNRVEMASPFVTPYRRLTEGRGKIQAYRFERNDGGSRQGITRAHVPTFGFITRLKESVLVGGLVAFVLTMALVGSLIAPGYNKRQKAKAVEKVKAEKLERNRSLQAALDYAQGVVQTIREQGSGWGQEAAIQNIAGIEKINKDNVELQVKAYRSLMVRQRNLVVLEAIEKSIAGRTDHKDFPKRALVEEVRTTRDKIIAADRKLRDDLDTQWNTPNRGLGKQLVINAARMSDLQEREKYLRLLLQNIRNYGIRYQMDYELNMMPGAGSEGELKRKLQAEFKALRDSGR